MIAYHFLFHERLFHRRFYDLNDYSDKDTACKYFSKPQTLTKTKYFIVERMTQILKQGISEHLCIQNRSTHVFGK